MDLTLGNLYEFNKEAMKNELPLDPMILYRKCLGVAEWMLSRELVHHYIMLLCHERRDYTIFAIDNNSTKSKASSEFCETICNRGDVIAIDQQKDGNYEIWIRDNEENFCYYLFNYDNGVVKI